MKQTPPKQPAGRVTTLDGDKASVDLQFVAIMSLCISLPLSWWLLLALSWRYDSVVMIAAAIIGTVVVFILGAITGHTVYMLLSFERLWEEI